MKHGRCTLLSLDEQTVLPQLLEHGAYMPTMFLDVLGEDKNIINVDIYAPAEKVPQHVVYEGLEDGRGIS